MTSQLPASLRIAQVVGITTSAFITGMSLSYTYQFLSNPASHHLAASASHLSPKAGEHHAIKWIDRISFWLSCVDLPKLMHQTGGFSTISYAAIPPLHLSPAPILARQWNELHDLGRRIALSVTLASALAFSYLATDAGKHPLRHSSYAFELYTGAAVFIPAFVPFTMFFMANTTEDLHAKAVDSKFGEEENLRKLVCNWRYYNYTRAGLTAVGALMGTIAVVGL
ncbi:hypothetical protein EJ05DRAFT_170875 [Pseudovirgaria hyperparasitica]|uniref:DUF1772-domain-containing protein n=1 Tax=Pseudovirgaria hyperparasitica TaxID=470096 RepID=A0A6A6VSV7_9PEZI|nr:uncharacterized protein EJ05DRAFT_170875 [Pseudovirgaria hyperparasitica]KAF2753758.1 hypothetical protein EJ05DRAFT_170875 [Pseudovirgaria hyperparasitica]